MVVHLLGVMCGAAANPDGPRDCGFFLFVIDPRLMHSGGGFERKVSDHVGSIRSSRPLDAEKPLRVPFERSHAERRNRIALDHGHASGPDP